MEDRVELICFVFVHNFPDTDRFELRPKFESCENTVCFDFNELFNGDKTYRDFNISLIDEGVLDSRIIINDMMGEVEIYKGTHITLADR